MPDVTRMVTAAPTSLNGLLLTPVIPPLAMTSAPAASILAVSSAASDADRDTALSGGLPDTDTSDVGSVAGENTL